MAGIRTIELDPEFLDDIRELIHTDARSSLVNIMADLHAADIADLLENLPEGDRIYVFGLLSPVDASEVLRELDEGVREPLLAGISTDGITQIIEELDSDDAADLVAELPEHRASEVLDNIEEDDAAIVERLMSYPEDTAGGIMATEVLTVFLTDTVKTAIRKARQFARQDVQLDNLYVTNRDGVLQGFLPVTDLILAGPGRKMKNVMEEVVSVKVDMDQEEVANLMQKYDLVSVPVINDEGMILGRITVDDIVDVIKEEAEEDIERMAGLVGSEERTTSIFQSSRIRLPWLLLGFAGGIISAYVLRSYQASLEQIIAAAFFIPIIMAMGGNAGIQSSAIVVRGLATGDVFPGQTRERLMKELGIALMNGLILSTLMFLVAHLWFNDMWFGLTVGLSLLVVVLNATVVGATIPLILDRFDIDPAIATGPFITTTNDALGLLIYFWFMSLIYL